MISLRAALRGADPARVFHGPDGATSMASLAAGTVLGDAAVDGRCAMLAVESQTAAAAALIELDGRAARILVCPPGLDPAHRATVAARAGVDLVVQDAAPPLLQGIEAVAAGALRESRRPDRADRATEWLLLTSGTTGAPKIVSHSLAGLTGAIAPPAPGASAPVWATFYDIRRYGGLQIFLRAVLGTGSMVLPAPDEPLAKTLARQGACGVTHLSGTPSHWRRVLMNPAARAIAPAYVRLSGEIADQAVLDALAAFFPTAKVGHAYASTEAGVGFEVTDGREGFPATYVDEGLPGVDMRVVDGTLRIRSTRTASAYVGPGGALVDADGFVDTGDIVARRGDRYYFAGRSSGIINIGGQKVHPEEIEAVLNGHYGVRMSLVKSRRNPIMGAIVAADVVPRAAPQDADALRRDIQSFCRERLEAWKAPATIRFVESLDVTSAGKLARHA